MEKKKKRLEKMVATTELMLALMKGVVDGCGFVPQTHSEKLATEEIYIMNYCLLLSFFFICLKLNITNHICMYVCI